MLRFCGALAALVKGPLHVQKLVKSNSSDPLKYFLINLPGLSSSIISILCLHVSPASLFEPHPHTLNYVWTSVLPKKFDGFIDP